MYDPSKLFIGLADEIVELFNTPVEFEIDTIGLELIQEGKESNVTNRIDS